MRISAPVLCPNRVLGSRRPERVIEFFVFSRLKGDHNVALNIVFRAPLPKTFFRCFPAFVRFFIKNRKRRNHLSQVVKESSQESRMAPIILGEIHFGVGSVAGQNGRSGQSQAKERRFQRVFEKAALFGMMMLSRGRKKLDVFGKVLNSRNYRLRKLVIIHSARIPNLQHEFFLLLQQLGRIF